MNSYKATEVFVPSDFPTVTYVKREEEKLEKRVRDAVDTPRSPISISGPSKTGKTALVRNIVVGVKEGYKENLEIQGVGYRCAMQGNTLVLQLGFSHEVRFDVPQGIKITVTDQTKILIEGIDKQAVGQTAAKIRSFEKPEPYKGKGIRYAGEYVFMKEGKKK